MSFLFCDPVLTPLLYIWFGCWSLGYLVFQGGVRPARNALEDWLEEWVERGWIAEDFSYWLIIPLVLLWPLTWLQIIRYWK